jgi:hypothetical protein
MLNFITSNPHFFLVISAAFICMIYCVINFIKYKKSILLGYIIFYLFSILSSTQSIYNFDKAYVSNLIFGLFFTFDFLFFYYYSKDIFTQNFKVFSRYLAYLSGLILFLFILNFPYPDKTVYFITSINSLFILILGLPVLIDIYKEIEVKSIIKEYQFWIVSGFLINSIATFVCSTILFYSASSMNIINQLLYMTMYLSWIIKYLMILKSNLCLVKNIKSGD